MFNKFFVSKNVLIVGKSLHTYTKLVEDIISKSSYNLLDVVDVDECKNISIEELKRKNIKKIILALDERRGNFPTRFLLDVKLQGIDIVDFNDVYEEVTGKIAIDRIYPSNIIFSKGFKTTILKSMLKRVFDIFLSIVVLIVFFPICLFTAILIKIDSKGSVFYTQKRMGKAGIEFDIFKFRSMRIYSETESGPIWAQKNDPRITKVGKIMRKFRIDEIPQVINVLKGDMSFVGPRPERKFFVEQLKDQIPYYIERLIVKPGITGWATVKSGYCYTVDNNIEKIQYDLYYIKHLSILFDIKILFYTIKVILFGEGM